MESKDFARYGHFDDAAREFVVSDPFPPTAWINYLSNGRLCSIVSQKAGGMTFLDSAAELRLTRYRQTRSVPMDRPGHWVYIREPDGALWSPTYEPTRARLDSWRCRHGMGYTAFEAERAGIKASTTFFIPPGDNVLVWDIRLENTRTRPASLLVVPYVEFSFQEMAEEVFSFHWCRMQLSFTYDKARGAIKYFYGPPYAQRRVNVFLGANTEPASFCCDRDAFIGRRGAEEAPEELVQGRLSNTELPGGGHGAGALGFDMALAPGESRRLCVLLGCADDWPQCDALLDKYKDARNADAGFAALKAFYDDFLGGLQVSDAPDADMRRFLNVWNPYNCRQAFERARFVSAIHTGMGGGMQSRDSVQDAMGIAHLKPEWARERVSTVLRYQHPDGRFIGTFDPRSKKPPHDDGTHVRCDNGVWSVYTIYAYLAETGDLAYLDERVPFYKGPEASVFDHLLVDLQYIANNQGANGLPLMFDQDWNDSLQQFKEEGCETVMLAQQLVHACRLLKEMAAIKGRPDAAAWCDNTVARLEAVLNSDVVWDGEWYRRVLYKSGRAPLGSKARGEAKIYLNTQSWAIISGTAPADRARLAMAKCEELLGTPYGFRLLWPPYTGTPEPPAPLLGNVPGVSENGGVFNHANTWAVIAAALMGDGDKAYEWYRRCLPPHAIREIGIERYMNEPYCYSSHIIAPPDPRAGMALLSWLSGTTTWMYIAATQYLLGLRPTLAGLAVAPRLPSAWRGYSAVRRFRGAEYRLRVQNNGAGPVRLSMDGKDVPGGVLPLLPKGAVAEVVATIG